MDKVQVSKSRTDSPRKNAGGSRDAGTASRPVSKVTHHDWSPLDDGIKVKLPYTSPNYTPTRIEVDAEVFSVIYGPRSKTRLPEFVQLYDGVTRI